MLRMIGKRLLTLLAIAGFGIAIIVMRKRSPVATPVGTDFRHPDRWVPWWATLEVMIDRMIGWYRLPLPLGLAVLIGVRRVLRAKNLYDTSALPSIPQPQPQ